MGSEYSPDAWVLLEFDFKGESVRKVLAGWYGGYAGSDEWRLSSGVTRVEDLGDSFVFHNESGSRYLCVKETQRFTNLMSSVYDSWQKEIEKTSKNELSVKTIKIIQS